MTGRVTGVGFRYSAAEKSREFPSLSGFIRNSGYSEIETQIQGSAEDVDKMVDWLRRGPALARVDSFDISEVPFDENIKEFRIKS